MSTHTTSIHISFIGLGLKLMQAWRRHFAVVLTLLLWGLFTRTSFAGTCATRTITNHSLPARSYTVDATHIEEVIATHTASVVWADCKTESTPWESLGTWIAYFPANFTTSTVNSGSDLFSSPSTLGGFDYDRYSNTGGNFFPVDSAHIRYRYLINCKTNFFNEIGFCLDDQTNAVPLDSAQVYSTTDYGLRMYVDLTWSGTNNDHKGCVQIAATGVWGWTEAGKAVARGMELRSHGCTSVKLDAKLTIVKTKPFNINKFENVATVNLTKTNFFKYSLCEPVSGCSGKAGSVKALGGPFDIFNSGKPLTINLTKTVRPTGNCIVKLKSKPTRSHL
jgi:hypothetical protein